MVEKPPVKYAVVDAFTDARFKGNPAAVCFLEEEKDEEWLLAVAREFNTPVTCYVTRIPTPNRTSHTDSHVINPTFLIRWFTTVNEVQICGHATLAAAHVLYKSGKIKGDVIEFLSQIGSLITKRIPIQKKSKASGVSSNGITEEEEEEEEEFYVELDFPSIEVLECDPEEIPSIPLTLNGASVINIKKMAYTNDLIVELSSGAVVANLKPHFEEIQKCSGRRGLLLTGIAPAESKFDFISRFFCPKVGVDEDYVCGSAHCALAPYWSKRLGKNHFTAYMASPRGGRLDVYLDEKTERVLIRGQAVAVMEGSLLA